MIADKYEEEKAKEEQKAEEEEENKSTGGCFGFLRGRKSTKKDKKEEAKPADKKPIENKKNLGGKLISNFRKVIGSKKSTNGKEEAGKKVQAKSK